MSRRVMQPDGNSDQVPDKDLPLKRDIRFLGRLLGDTLREQQGDATFKPGTSVQAVLMIVEAVLKP